MKFALRTIKFPRPARLHPSGVTFEVAWPSDPPSGLTARVPGGPAPAGEGRAFKFQKVVTAQS